MSPLSTIFISYTHIDSHFVDRLEADLQKQQLTIWMDRRGLAGGQHWRRELQDAIDRAQVMLVVLSPEAVASENVQAEYGYAIDEGKLVIPLYYRACKIPLELRSLQWIDFQHHYDAGLASLLQTLRQYIGTPLTPGYPGSGPRTDEQKPLPMSQGLPYMLLQRPPYSPPPQGRQSSMVRNIIFAVIALMIILGGLGSFFVVHNNQINQQNIETATATALTNMHAKAATATANAKIAATAAANATFTALTTSPYPSFTHLAFYDPLTSDNSNSQWDNNIAGCQFTSRGYQASVAQVRIIHWCNNNMKQFGELAYQATMTISQGDCGGLVYRYVNSTNFYLFEVCQNGTYNVGDYSNGVQHLYPNAKSSSAIYQGTNQSNVIAVTVQGNTINMYVNGQNIDVATIDALTSSFTQGEIGLLASDTVDPTSVTYMNALVWTAS